MAKPGSFYRSVTLQPFTVFSVLAALVADVQGGDGCASFSCGHLQDVRYPFRRPGDPPECGVRAFELVCSSSKATIYISKGTCYVTDINYTRSSFWVVDAKLDANSSCPLAGWNQPFHHYREYCLMDSRRLYSSKNSRRLCDLETDGNWACFVNCSRAITRNPITINDGLYKPMYKPVACLSSNSSHVYVVLADHCQVGNLEPFCGYLAMIPFGGLYLQLQNASYADIIELIRKGFSVRFPRPSYSDATSKTISETISMCLNNSISYYKEQISDANILNWARTFFWGETHFLECVAENTGYANLIVVVKVIISAIDIPKFLVVLCRFVLAPLVVLIFLAHMYWKTRITTDAVEKFLRMQQMIGPTRYGYTDITAITSHFRDKLGQGGYGSIFKGVLLPGNVHIAVKMLVGNSNCNGEDFINEVSTIGRIHHVNVVRLVGFCSEEMRRALVYEYMPRGSLDKYIFSAEKSFSWDKLNGIALGIARGINYLHQGCDMQILHFDIKPHNILLDSNFIPKVADFGLAKLYPRDNSFVPLSALRGTVGYIAPEMISRSFGVISNKSDVYSFGMLLLEMAGGRRNADPNAGNSSQAYYPLWVYDRLTNQEVGEISVADDMHELEKKLCIVGLWCIQMKSQDRPMMSEVIEMLKAGADGLQIPSRPFFCDEGHTHIEDSYHLASELTTISEDDE